MDDIYLRKVMATVIVLGLLVLSFLLIKPILISIIVALILAFVFSPVYEWLYKVTKLKNISAFLICILLISLIVLPFWFLVQIFKRYYLFGSLWTSYNRIFTRNICRYWSFYLSSS